MPISKKILPLAAMEKVLKQAGADRVSDKAKIALKDIIEEQAEQIAAQAVKLAIHAGRKTVKAVDIKLAVNKLIGEILWQRRWLVLVVYKKGIM